MNTENIIIGVRKQYNHSMNHQAGQPRWATGGGGVAQIKLKD